MNEKRINVVIISIVFFMFWCLSCKQQKESHSISFDVFAQFERIEQGNPILAGEPPEWGAAAHAIVVEDTVHYIWAKREIRDRRWVMMHSMAPIENPADVSHDPRNPILYPTEQGFDNAAVEYPFPFKNPADAKYYCYYLGRGKTTPKQTGLLVSEGDLGQWKRVQSTPVIPATAVHEQDGSSHPSVTIVDDTIHIIYTGKYDQSNGGIPTVCHATASIHNPAAVTKNPNNPVFTGSGQQWDSQGVREAEIYKGPNYFHIFYGGYDDQTWRIGHVRTRDFKTFEANPNNPIFIPSEDPNAWDSDGILTPQVFDIGDVNYMLYAGLKGREWQTGLARAPKMP